MRVFAIFILLSAVIYAQSNIEFICINEIKDTTVHKNLFQEFNDEYIAAGESVVDTIIFNSWYNEFKPRALELIKPIVSDSSMLWMDLGCNKNGRVEKILYLARNIQNDALETALTNFFDSFSYPIKMDRKYSQCGSFRFSNQ